MKYYLVKETSVATDQNPSFAGEVAITHYGKDQYLLARSGSHAVTMHSEKAFNDYQIREHGYTRRCDAVRSWIYKNPENTKYWQSTVEIVEVEI